MHAWTSVRIHDGEVEVRKLALTDFMAFIQQISHSIGTGLLVADADVDDEGLAAASL